MIFSQQAVRRTAGESGSDSNFMVYRNGSDSNQTISFKHLISILNREQAFMETVEFRINRKVARAG